MAYEKEAVTLAEAAYSIAVPVGWVSMFEEQFKIRNRIQNYLERKIDKLHKFKYSLLVY
jgi:hypothetical protein